MQALVGVEAIGTQFPTARIFGGKKHASYDLAGVAETYLREVGWHFIMLRFGSDGIARPNLNYAA